MLKHLRSWWSFDVELFEWRILFDDVRSSSCSVLICFTVGPRPPPPPSPSDDDEDDFVNVGSSAHNDVTDEHESDCSKSNFRLSDIN